MEKTRHYARIAFATVFALALIVSAIRAPGVGRFGISYADEPDFAPTVEIADDSEAPFDIADETTESVADEDNMAQPDEAVAQQPVTVQLDPVAESGVSGTANLTAQDGATEASLEVTGLTPGSTAQSSLHAGTCDQASASFTAITELTAGDNGVATASGPVLFRGSDDVALTTMTDGDHIIAISSAGQLLACGSIPQS